MMTIGLHLLGFTLMTAVVAGLVDDDYRAELVGVYPDDCCRSWTDLLRDVKRWLDASNSVFVF